MTRGWSPIRRRSPSQVGTTCTPKHSVWNRIPPNIHDQIIELALEQSELSPRELAVRFTDERRYFVSEATVYRLMKAHDLITSPAYVVIMLGPIAGGVHPIR